MDNPTARSISRRYKAGLRKWPENYLKFCVVSVSLLKGKGDTRGIPYQLNSREENPHK